MTVVLVEPGGFSRIERFRGELKDMQKLIGGGIETLHVFPDSAVVIGREKTERALQPNRTIDGNMIGGIFFICGTTEDDFTSLGRSQLDKYLREFHAPE